MFRTTVNVNTTVSTELPFVSIAAEYWRGLIELGAVWKHIGGVVGRDDVVEAGTAMLTEATPLHADIMAAMNRSLVNTGNELSPRCWPVPNNNHRHQHAC